MTAILSDAEIAELPILDEVFRAFLTVRDVNALINRYGRTVSLRYVLDVDERSELRWTNNFGPVGIANLNRLREWLVARAGDTPSARRIALLRLAYGDDKSGHVATLLAELDRLLASRDALRVERDKLGEELEKEKARTCRDCGRQLGDRALSMCSVCMARRGDALRKGSSALTPDETEIARLVSRVRELEASDVPPCWRCKKRPGVVCDGTCNECVECAGKTMRSTRETLNAISDACREGLTAWPRIMDRVEFVRECIKLHREQAAASAHREPE